jgi:uncharacterized alpha-E superfamily protein
MLSRTADHLFWLARYMERAENTARMLDVNYQTSLLPQTAAAAERGWRGLLSIFELTADYEARYGAVDAQRVQEFMVRDERNPSSILSCLREARENARAMRGSLTTEVWETTNQTWLEFKRLLVDGLLERDPSALCEWVKFRSHLSRGVAVGTMLQDEAFNFMRIGSFLERADNTARLLDVKFQVNPVSAENKAEERAATASAHASIGARDFYHWSAVLRSVSGFEIYRKVYSNVILPEKVADLLILRSDMPRSLAHCTGRLLGNLKRVANDQSTDTLRQAGRLHADLEYCRIDDIMRPGLHVFLNQFLDRIGKLGMGISRDFLMPAA